MKTKKRNWQFTLNEVEKYKQLSNYLKNKKTLKYLVSCKEIAPKTGHEHIHIFTHFSNSFKPNIKKCCGAHIELCRGSIKDNINYIKKLKNEKDEIIEEYGEVPEFEEKEKLTIRKLKEKTKEEREDVPAVYFKTVEKINSIEDCEIDLDNFYKKVNTIYIWGETGIGKTRLACAIIKELKKQNEKYKKFNIVKYSNNFWLGIGESSIALYDDFRDNHMKPSEFINFIDYYKHTLNIKNGFKINNYEYIIITSIQNPENLYEEYYETNEQKNQWLRRIKIIYLNNFNINNINISDYI